MSVKCFSAAVTGIDAVPVEVEVKISAANMPALKESMITIVGLPDAAVRESRERITAAFSSSKFALPSIAHYRKHIGIFRYRLGVGSNSK